MKLATILGTTLAAAAAIGAYVYYTSDDNKDGVSDVSDDVVDNAKEVNGERVD